MFNTCPGCGQYSVEKTIDPAGPFAVCPFCGHRHRFLQLPLFVVTGASATGKTTVCLALQSSLPECVVLECDVLWRPEFADPENDYRAFRDVWLRLAKNIGQAGRPVVLCGSAIPAQYEPCPERRYFSVIHYLALVCDDAELVHRLEARPGWRGSSDPATVENMLGFNRWLKENAQTTQPPMTLLDTTWLAIDESARRTGNWVRAHLGGYAQG
jgi:hypothetical protein